MFHESMSFMTYKEKRKWGWTHQQHGGKTTEDVERRINRLETSLSDTLSRFYPLAGRYVKDSEWVDYNDEGVEYFEAKVEGGPTQ